VLSLIIKSVVRHFLSQDKRLQSEDSDEEKGHMKQQAGTNMVVTQLAKVEINSVAM
jgi:hypothetical protein